MVIHEELQPQAPSELEASSSYICCTQSASNRRARAAPREDGAYGGVGLALFPHRPLGSVAQIVSRLVGPGQSAVSEGIRNGSVRVGGLRPGLRLLIAPDLRRLRYTTCRGTTRDAIEAVCSHSTGAAAD
jgi:hypothetical protein